MTNRELEQRLKRAVDSTAPDHLEALLSRCEPKKGNVISMEHMMAKKRSGWARGLVAAVLALLLVGTGSGLTIGFMNYRQSYALASVVSLDINPSIELKVNRNEKVLACTGMNEDGTKVLSTMNGGKDLEGASLDLAVNALVGALLREGYMDVYSAMLISVEDNDQERAAQLRQRLVASVDGELQSAGAQVNVRSQSMSMNRQLSAQAQANNISSGKAYLVNQVRDLNSTLDFNELAQLSVEELDELIDAGAPGMPVGMAAAREAAKTYAGIQNNSTVTASVDAELDKNPARYDVSLFINDAEVVYRVDAYTGAGCRMCQVFSRGRMVRPRNRLAVTPRPLTRGQLQHNSRPPIRLLEILTPDRAVPLPPLVQILRPTLILTQAPILTLTRIPTPIQTQIRLPRMTLERRLPRQRPMLTLE